jgi:hypothetical protein
MARLSLSKSRALLLALIAGGAAASAPGHAGAPALSAGLERPDPREEPTLPAGQSSDDGEGAPTLPAGLDAAPAGEPPGLPPGLDAPSAAAGDRPSAPPSPPGDGATSGVPGPALPEGLEPDAAVDDPAAAGRARSGAGPGALPALGEALDGFVETRLGFRTGEDPYQKSASIMEARAQLASQWNPGASTIRVVGDLIYDDVEPDRRLDLETGRGWLDLREASLVFRPTAFADVKMGRQILTWGTGDLIFINDLFPKDFRAFFIGRDEEYLKAPSDAVRVSGFFDLLNVDLAYTPRFDPDRAIDGSRLTFFNPLLGRRSGRDAVLDIDAPDDWFADDEIALRLYRNLGAYETALYFYDGFWKSPAGFSDDGRALHPALRVYGASIRGPLRGGIFNAEVGHYDSRDDQSGLDPFIQNGETRFLLGYEREIASELTLGVQYFGQRTTDFDEFLEALPPGFRIPDEVRHTVTVRLTRLAMNQNLTLSLFNFWSPNDDDGHLRLRASYKVTDSWRVEGGVNLFYGPGEQTFFAQLDSNSNVFAAVRRSF